jgi:stalled ribosome rescue protein Dom34
MPKTYKRGYPIAVLIGIENDHAVLWQIFSQVAQRQQTIPLKGNRNDAKVVYSFHESIINGLRPVFKEGVKSIVVASPPKTNYGIEFQNHIKAHHSWLTHGPSKAFFSSLMGSASTSSEVAALSKTTVFKQLVSETTAEETEDLLEILNKRLSSENILVFFSLEEAENLIISQQTEAKLKPEFLLLTDNYLSSSRQKSRIHRILQIAKNRQVKTRIISAESTAGKRIAQLGGIVCLAKPE